MTSQDNSTGASRLQSRARDLLERAERMQDLHAQAQAQVLAGRAGAPASAVGQVDATRLLEQTSNQAIADLHLALQDAAHQARRLAQADPEIARLNARIHGAKPEPTADVIDVVATEVVEESPSGPQEALPSPTPPGAPDTED
jgi:hypothetical protein